MPLPRGVLLFGSGKIALLCSDAAELVMVHCNAVLVALSLVDRERLAIQDTGCGEGLLPQCDAAELVVVGCGAELVALLLARPSTGKLPGGKTSAGVVALPPAPWR